MNIADRVNLAIAKKHSGSNCAQSVIFAYQEDLKLNEEEIKRLGAPFGLGMGKMEGNCGALIGAQIVKGLLSEGKPMHNEANALLSYFGERAKAITCKELKGKDTGKVLSSCDECVEIGVRAVSEAV